MAEPLNNDQEFENIKDFFNTEWQELDPLSEQMQKDGKRLIATIELQKSDKDLGRALVRKIQELKEEVERLKMDEKNLIHRMNELLEKNAKLKEDYYVPSVTIGALEAEIKKLKDEITELTMSPSSNYPLIHITREAHEELCQGIVENARLKQLLADQFGYEESNDEN